MKKKLLDYAQYANQLFSLYIYICVTSVVLTLIVVHNHQSTNNKPSYMVIHKICSLATLQESEP